MKKSKQNKAVVFLIATLIGFVLLYIFGDYIHEFASNKIQSTQSEIKKEQSLLYIDSAFNYINNELPYEFTLLEFGANTCLDCKNMEEVLVEIQHWEKFGINVIFVYVRSPEYQHLIEHYGISEIPVQIVLDKEARIIFRHTGYISAKELKQIFNSNYP